MNESELMDPAQRVKENLELERKEAEGLDKKEEGNDFEQGEKPEERGEIEQLETEKLIEEKREKIGKREDSGQEGRDESPRKFYETHKNSLEDPSEYEPSGIAGRYIKKESVDFREKRAASFMRTVGPMIERMSELEKVRTLVSLCCGQLEIFKEVVAKINSLKVGDAEKSIGLGFDIRDQRKEFSGKIFKDSQLAFVQGDATDTKLADGSVDLVEIGYGLQIMDTQDMQIKLLEEAKRILNKDGYILLSDIVKRDGWKGSLDAAKHCILNIKDENIGEMIRHFRSSGTVKGYNVQYEKGYESLFKECGLEVEEKQMLEDGRSIVYMLKLKDRIDAENGE